MVVGPRLRFGATMSGKLIVPRLTVLNIVPHRKAVWFPIEDTFIE